MDLRLSFKPTSTFEELRAVIIKDASSVLISHPVAEQHYSQAKDHFIRRQFIESFYLIFRLIRCWPERLARKYPSLTKNFLDLYDSVKDRAAIQFEEQKILFLERTSARASMDGKQSNTVAQIHEKLGATPPPPSAVANTITNITATRREEEDGIAAHPMHINYLGAPASSWSMRQENKENNPRFFGLVNLGNTCYMNSVLQILRVSRLGTVLRSDKLRFAEGAKNISSVRLTNCFQRLLKELDDATSAISPKAFKKTLGEVYEPFNGTSQQDANEFLHVLFDSFHNALNTQGSTPTKCVELDNKTGSDSELAAMYAEEYAKRDSSIIINLLGHQERSCIACPCGQIYRSFINTIGLEVPIPEPSHHKTCLEDCLASYCREEKLEEASLFSCDSCKRKTQASKQLTLFTCPQLLVISLKRFQRSHGLTKIDREVFFQPTVNLAPFMCGDKSASKYRLIGVVNHSGSLNSGHYTADVLADDVWHHCSDDVITASSNPSFGLAYILLYAKCNN